MIFKRINKNLKLVLIIVILIFSLSFVSSEETRVFRINLKYLNETLTVKDVSLVKMHYFQEVPSEGKYTIKILSYLDDVLFSQKFYFSLKAFDVDDSSQITYLTESTEELILPYFSDAKKLVIYDNNKIILEYDLSMYTTPKIIEEDGNIYFYVIIFLMILIIFIIKYLRKK